MAQKDLTQAANAANVAKGPKDYIGSMITRMESEIARALPDHIASDRFSRILTTALKSTPELAECHSTSILSAIMLSSQLGLEPGLLGQCYLIPYYNKKTKRKEAQFQLGYKGLLELVRRSGQISTLSARWVYEKDFFDVELGFEETIQHKPHLEGDRGALKLCYAIAVLKDGSRQFCWMSKEEIEKHRNKFSKTSGFGPWVDNFEAMGEKTVLKRLCKLLPLSPDIVRDIEQDGRIKRNLAEDMTEVQEGEDEALEDVDATIVDDETNSGDEGGSSSGEEGKGSAA